MIRLLNPQDYDTWMELAKEVEPLFADDKFHGFPRRN